MAFQMSKTLGDIGESKRASKTCVAFDCIVMNSEIVMYWLKCEVLSSAPEGDTVPHGKQRVARA
jgi:hypothetical protein